MSFHRSASRFGHSPPLTLLGALALALVAAPSSGCKKDSSSQAPAGEPVTSATTDALWAFAPPAPDVAVVIADGSLAPIHAGALRLLADLERAPGGAGAAAMMRKEAAGVPINPLDPAALAAAGIDLTRGAAVFESAAGKVAVLPVSDPEKLLAKVGGTSEGGIDRLGSLSCKRVNDRYVCASSAELLDAAGAGKEGAALVAAWPKTMRGQVEVFVSQREMDAAPPLDAPQGIRMSAQIERGAVTARVHLIGVPKGPMAAARGARSPLLTGLADEHPVGLLVVSAAGPWKEVQAKMAADAAAAPPLPGGVAVADLINALTGEVVGHALPGQPQRGAIRIGVSNEEPFRKLLAACGQIAAAAPPGLVIEAKEGLCLVTARPELFGGMPGMSEVSAEIRVEEGALVIGLGDRAATSGARPALTPFAREILDGSWLVALWGYGSLASGSMLTSKAQLDAVRAQDPTGGLAMWALHHMSELGVAVRIADDGIHGALRIRTLWANPDEVVTAAQGKIAELLAGNDGALADIAALAEKHPDSPLARDMKAGATGLVVPFAAIGAGAAVAIPAFMKYRARAMEAAVPSPVAAPPPPAGGADLVGTPPGP